MFAGEFEERLKSVIDEVQQSDGEIVLFIDEMHTVVGAGVSRFVNGVNENKLSSPWSLLLLRKLRIFGTTSLKEIPAMRNGVTFFKRREINRQPRKARCYST